MKRTARLLALLLALVMCGGILASCGNRDPENTTTAPTTTAPGTTGPAAPTAWDALDFSDVELCIAYDKTIAGGISSTGASNSFQYLKGPDDYGESTRGDYKAAYERHALVCDALDLTLGENFTYKMEEHQADDVNTVLPKIQSYNLSTMPGTPNIYITVNYGIVRAGITGELHNALDTTWGENYLDLTHENWYLEMMQENALDTSKIYMLMGDYFIDQLRYSFGILYNSRIAEDVLFYEGGLDYLYGLVENYEWTYDTMMEISSWAQSGTGNTLVMGTISNDWVVRNFFASSGLDIFKRDANGEPFYINGTELDPVLSWINKMIEIENQEHFSYDWARNTTQNINNKGLVKTFVDGGALFVLNQMVCSLEGAQINNMKDKAGILPNPLYVAEGESVDPETAKYRGLVSDNANSGGILISSSAEEFSAATAFLQMMTEYSDEFFEAYFVDGLQNRDNAIGPNQIKMLDILRNGISSPMSMLYDNYCAKSIGYDVYAYPIYEILDKGTNTYTNFWASQYTGISTQWANIKQSYGERTE